jgi:hypothetical protein
MYKDLESAVPSVPSLVEPFTADLPPATAVIAGEPPLRLPFLTAGGTLVIPMESPERYHWWKPDGQRLTVAETLAEVRAALANPERMNYADAF